MNYIHPPIERLMRQPEPDFSLGYTNPFWVPSPSEAAKAAPVEGSDAAEKDAQPPVITPVERNLTSEVAELLTSVTEYVSSFAITDTPVDFEKGYSNPLSTERPAPREKCAEEIAFENRRDDLLRELQTWSTALTRFLSDHRLWLVNDLQRQHGQAWRTARQQDGVVEALRTRLDESGTNLRKLQAKLSETRSVLGAHAAARPNLGRLPSRGQVEAWTARDAELVAAFHGADRAVDEALDHHRALIREYESEQRKLAECTRREQKLRSQIGGEVTTVNGLAEETTL